MEAAIAPRPWGALVRHFAAELNETEGRNCLPENAHVKSGLLCGSHSRVVGGCAASMKQPGNNNEHESLDSHGTQPHPELGTRSEEPSEKPRTVRCTFPAKLPLHCDEIVLLRL